VNDNPEYLCHYKFWIQDNRVVGLGSANWTFGALKKNWENVCIIDGVDTAKEYTKIFEKVWM
jgi:phosphatidylserine/phosphatidylglycerophosphate/cardiolipin synthase-like enzyme